MSEGPAAVAIKKEDLIEIRNVNMRFRYQSVLRGINLAIHRGETVCIIGESGCGKTVMLKLIIGLLHPSEGDIRFDGRDVAKLNGKELVKMRLRFGFLFQMAALFDSLTVFDNVAFGLREHHYLRRGTRSPDRRRAAAGGRLAAGDRVEEARRAVGRAAKARRAGQGPGDRAGSHALRRADHRAGSDHERRDQRAHPPNPALQEDDRRGRDP